MCFLIVHYLNDRADSSLALHIREHVFVINQGVTCANDEFYGLKFNCAFKNRGLLKTKC